MREGVRRATGRPRHERLQTVLSVLAMGTAVMLPVVLLSVGGGVMTHELRSLENAGYEVAVSAAGVHGIADSHTLSTRIDQVPNIAAASPALTAAIDAFAPGSGARPILAEGIIPAAFAQASGPTERSLFHFPLPLGDPTDAVHYANGSYDGPASNAVMISTPFAEGTGLAVGDRLGLATTANATRRAEFNVTGIFGVLPTVVGPPTSFAIVLPLSDLQLLTGEARANGTSGPLLDGADVIQVALLPALSTDPAAVTAAANAIQALVPYYGVTSLLDEARQLQGGAAVLTGFYLALSSVGLSVGLIFLALMLLRRVERQRRAIGIRRAIGVPARSIARDTIIAGATLAASGAAVGTAAGIVLVEGLTAWGSAAVQTAAGLAIFDPVTLFLLGGSVVLLSLAASGVAVRAALRQSIPEALR